MMKNENGFLTKQLSECPVIISNPTPDNLFTCLRNFLFRGKGIGVKGKEA